jgi:hypothetical protein
VIVNPAFFQPGRRDPTTPEAPSRSATLYCGIAAAKTCRPAPFAAVALVIDVDPLTLL